MKNKKSLVFIISTIIITILLSLFNVFEKADRSIQDAVFMSNSPIIKIDRPISDKIIVVGIDEESVQEFGRWPWDRSVMASAIDILNEKGAAVIGIDVIYSDYSDEENDNRKNAAAINGEEIIYDDEEVFKTEEEIRSMKKDELIAYAEEIGIQDFNTIATKDVMIDAILNYIEENSIDVEEVIK